ncbi:carbon-nitrogen hydrolase family protein [Nitratireductor mangrovi]|uniref:carbon-nitrogen hydrolase family protein n=1 Tax=Nitratireductor mangrovi TaxID=2599600 RepID=UPI0011B18BDD|nr:carbon-nitrogen hydrolase family protein [Nitratireductor mangrovi]
MTRFKAAALQMRSGMDPAENARAFEAMVREAARLGASYVQSPEMTGALVRDRATLRKIIRPQEEDSLAATARRLAAELAITVHLGSTPIALADGKVANRAFLFGPDGALVAIYDKIHMFDVDLDHGESWRESATYQPGGAAMVAELPLASIGLAICYDLRFPQLFRAQAMAGAQVLTAPAAFTRQTGEAHWHVLTRARAIENGAWMIAAAQGGLHQDGRETFGHSVIVDPWGGIAAEAEGDEPGIIVADIDTEASTKARAKIPNLRNGRDFAVEVAAAGATAARRAAAS